MSVMMKMSTGVSRIQTGTKRLLTTEID